MTTARMLVGAITFLLFSVLTYAETDSILFSGPKRSASIGVHLQSGSILPDDLISVSSSSVHVASTSSSVTPVSALVDQYYLLLSEPMDALTMASVEDSLLPYTISLLSDSAYLVTGPTNPHLHSRPPATLDAGAPQVNLFSLNLTSDAPQPSAIDALTDASPLAHTLASWTRASARAVLGPEALLAASPRGQFYDFIRLLRAVPGAIAAAHVTPAQKLSASALDALERPEEHSAVDLWVSLATLPDAATQAFAAAAAADGTAPAPAHPASLSPAAVASHWNQTSSPCPAARPLSRALTLHLSVPAPALPACLLHLASRAETAWITRAPRLALLNNRSKPTVQDRGLRATSLWDRGMTGAGQAVIVGDTGVDHDHCMFHDPDSTSTAHIGKRDSAAPDWSQRKIIWYTTDYGDEHDDSGGHGTHVAGTIAGSVRHTNEALVEALSPYNGHAPDAKLVVIDFKRTRRNELNVPEDLYEGIFAPYTARVDAGLSSHSWGGETEYNAYSRDVDRFVADQPFHLPVFAAGNDGESGFGTVLSPGNAKNALTVGASVNAHVVKTIAFAADAYFPALEATYASAAFGAAVSFASRPALVLAQPQDGCAELLYDTSFYQASPYKGAAVVVTRGTCPFTDKAVNAYKAGAASVLVVNDVAGAPTEMGYDGTKPNVGTLSALMLDRTVGERLIAYLLRSPSGQGGDIALGEDDQWAVLRVSGPADGSAAVYDHTMASFSSRGPAPDGRVKPDISAAGKGIYSARSDGTVSATANCIAPSAGGVLSMSGTSMATPLVAGSMALLRQYFASGAYAAAALKNTAGDAPSVADAASIAAMARTRTDTGAPSGDAAPGSIVPSAAGLKAVAVAAGVNAGGEVPLYSGGAAYLDAVTPAPMSVFQGWGLLNLGHVATFADQFALPVLTGADPAPVYPANRLHLFDSLSEDVATLQALARLPEPTPGLTRWLARAGVDAQGLGLTSLTKVDDELRKLLPPAAPAAVAAPSSHATATQDDASACSASTSASASGLPLCPLTQRCGDDAPSCGLAPHAQHRHCAAVLPLDALTLANALVADGAVPAVNVNVNATADVPRLTTTLTGFAAPASPYTPAPALARASLAWTDPAGSIVAPHVLVNDLDLLLMASSTAGLFVDIDNGIAGTLTKTGAPDPASSVQVDFAKYRRYYPQLFDHFDAQAKLASGAALPRRFTAQLMPATFAAAGNQRADDAAATAMRLDGVNNVEQASLPLAALDNNPYVLAAAAVLGLRVPVTAVVRAGALSTAGQHYALAMTGAAPSSAFEGVASTPTFPTAAQPQPLAASSVCGLADESLFCPRGCSGHGACVNGQCVCAVPADADATPLRGGPDCGTAPQSLADARTACEPNDDSTSACGSDALGPALYGPLPLSVSKQSWAHLALPRAAVADAVALLQHRLSSNGTAAVVAAADVYLGIRVKVASVSGPVQPAVQLKWDPSAPPSAASALAAPAAALKAELDAAAATVSRMARAGALRSLSASDSTSSSASAAASSLPAALAEDPSVTWVRGDTAAAGSFLYLGLQGDCCRDASVEVTVLLAAADASFTTTDYLVMAAMLLAAAAVAYCFWRCCCARACRGKPRVKPTGAELEGGAGVSVVNGRVVVVQGVELADVGSDATATYPYPQPQPQPPSQPRPRPPAAEAGIGGGVPVPGQAARAARKVKGMLSWGRGRKVDRTQYADFTDAEDLDDDGQGDGHGLGHGQVPQGEARAARRLSDAEAEMDMSAGTHVLEAEEEDPYVMHAAETGADPFRDDHEPARGQGDLP